MNKKKKLPVGIEFFEKIRKNDYYYVDKTKLIETLLDTGNEVTLFTRPRRFGKSLTMDMLKCFFEVGTEKDRFDGLYISGNTKLCEAYMGKFPVVSISLKSVNAGSYEDARDFLIGIINEESLRFQFLLESEKLTKAEKLQFEKLLEEDMKLRTLASSLRKLTDLLEKHYGSKVILLIDEYDVPLAKAHENGYYDEMLLLIRNLFENALKTNPSLGLAVLTGCLRIAKESIFTGLNNFKVFSIKDVVFDEYFGFTDKEVRDLLAYYDQADNYDVVREWYDGYRFGNVDVYCPWDVINYCYDHKAEPKLPPKNYWINTSGNDILLHFIEQMEEEREFTRMELERLINGESVQREISEELTYRELYASTDNLWSALYMTGYLTKRGEPDGDRYELAVPNLEIRDILTKNVLTLFKRAVKKDGELLRSFCDALLAGEAEIVEELFTRYMNKTISVRDTSARRTTKENFYYGLLLGILSYKGGWYVRSNRETGDGFGDILVEIDDADVGIVIEVKYAEKGKEEAECRKALAQIADRRYAEAFYQREIPKVLKYGIACHGKRCRVLLETERDALRGE